MQHVTTVEVVLLSADAGTLRYRTVSAPLPTGPHPGGPHPAGPHPGGPHPDDLALHLSGLTLCTPGATLHSTSWRFVDDAVVLTYAALPDPAPVTGAPAVDVDRMVIGGAALAPSPAAVDADAVAAHAARHLALLVNTDPVVAEVAALQPDLWDLLAKIPQGLAGGLHTIHSAS